MIRPAAFALATYLFSSIALGQVSPGDDVITLRDGTLLRGHVSESRPGQSVTIVLLDGRTRQIPWSEIARSAGPSFPGTEPPPPPTNMPVYTPPANPPIYPPMAAQSDDYRTPGPGRVPLIVQSAGREQTVAVSLAEMAVAGPGGTAYGIMMRELCTTPCTLYVRPGMFPLITGGHGVRTASSHIDVSPTGTRVVMRAPSAWAFFGGFMMVAVGGAALVGGATLIGLGAMESGSSYTAGSANGLYIGGGITAGAGALLLVGGIILLATNPAGPQSTEPVRDARNRRVRWTAGAAPLPGGGLAVATLQF